MAHPIPAVRMFVQNDAGKVLLLRRSENQVGSHFWCLPGGKVDYGETIEQTARRELLEETSLVCKTLRFRFHQDSLPAEPNERHYINFYFEASAQGAIQLNDESEEYAWIGPSEMARYRILFRNDEALQKYWG